MRALRKLVEANVRSSCQGLETDRGGFSSDLTELAEALGQEVPFVFGEGRGSASPIFYGSPLKCEQQEFFGFYVLRETIRGCFSATNFQLSGSILLSHNLFAPAIASFYTSAFHALGTYLALYGRVLIDKESLYWIADEEPPAVLAGCLSRQNSWVFENRSRAHPVRWRELKHLFIRQGFEIPWYFRHLFRTLFPSATKGKPTLLERLEDPQRYSAEIEDFLHVFLEYLPQIRHRGLYRASGEDPYAKEVLVNDDGPISLSQLGQLASSYGIFSEALLEEAAVGTRRLIGSVKLGRDRMLMLALGIGYPFRDVLQLNLWQDDHPVKIQIEAIESWLKQGTAEQPPPS